MDCTVVRLVFKNMQGPLTELKKNLTFKFFKTLGTSKWIPVNIFKNSPSDSDI